MKLFLPISFFLLSITAHAQQCGYNYFNDTTWIKSCTVKDTSIPYTCFTGKWIFKKKSTCYKDSSYQVCDSVMKVTKDSTAKPCQPKPRLSGLVLRNFNWAQTKYPDWNYFTNVPGSVINIKLKDISIAEGVYDWTAIDTCLLFSDKAKAQGINYRYKLRICNGFPDWMKSKFGSFAVPSGGYDQVGWAADGDSICVKWWTDEYLNAYAAIMQAIADRYDNEDRIADVVIDATAFGTAEPFNMAIGNSGFGLQRKNAYINAGLTDSLRLAAIYKSIDLMQCFKRTNVSIALNPFEHIAKYPTESNTSKQVGEYICKMFGARAVLGNNGLRPASVDIDWKEPAGVMYDLEMFYNAMRIKYGSGVYNQTASTKQMGGAQNITKTFDYGMFFGIEYCEHPDTQKVFVSEITADELTYYSKQFFTW